MGGHGRNFEHCDRKYLGRLEQIIDRCLDIKDTVNKDSK